MSERKTNEEFLQELKDKGRDDLMPLDQYINNKTKIRFKCLKDEDHEVWEAIPCSILKGRGCPTCARERTLQPENYINKIESMGLHLISKYNGLDAQVTLQCDNGHIWHLKQARTVYSHGRKGCPYCLGNIRYEGYSIEAVYPELVKYFKNKEEAKTITTGQKDVVIQCKCPDCNEDFQLKVSQLIYNKTKCPFCENEGISKPNKLLLALLQYVEKQCQIIKREYSPTWAKQYSYDGYFRIDNKDYLVEMHGAFHYIEKDFIDFKDQQLRDKEKERLAKENNHNLIVIECIDTDYDYMINHILQSEIPNILDLTKINWEQIKLKCTTTTLKNACKLFMDGKQVHQIANELMINKSTVEKYLKQGASLGLCNYDPKLNTIKYYRKVRLIKIDTGESQDFESINSLVCYLHSLGFNTGKNTIFRYLRGWYYDYKKGIKKKITLDHDYNGYKFEYIEDKNQIFTSD